MQRGYELIQDQLFFRRELIERAGWFVNLRWIAGGAVLLGTWAGHYFYANLPLLPLSRIGVAIVFYNALFFLICRRLRKARARDPKPFSVFAHAQISIDLLALFFIIYYTGGITSPVLFFVLFHIILAGILLPPAASFLYGMAVWAAAAGLVAMEKFSLPPPQPALFSNSLPAETPGLPRMLAIFFVLGALVFISAFLVTTIKMSLRAKGRDLLRISKDLDLSNARLTALYEMVKEMGLCSDLQILMASATRNAATIMGVKACSIKLLDDERRFLKFSAAYGLSEDYLSQKSIDIEKSPINRKIIQGDVYAAGKIHEKNEFEHPENLRKEGIASMVCLPLRVEKTILGVFCVYSAESDDFSEADTHFFSTMADLTALAMGNLKRDLDKNWFLQKAAHQLNSPLNAIDSMLKLIRQRFLGHVNEKQEETLIRCEKRIALSRALMKELLDLGKKRTDIHMIAIHSVDGAKILRGVAELYQTQAFKKNIAISFHVEDPVPGIMADEKLMDDLFSNLISNAIKYTPADGTVRVTLAGEKPNWVKLEVSDTGIGIPEEDIPNLFSEFFRSENAKALVEDGTGLGLVIVKEIVSRLRGTISVESKLGEGTSFVCLIPSV